MPHTKQNQDVSNILLGVFSSLLLVTILRVYELVSGHAKFGYLFGKFYRIRFYKRETNPQNGENAYHIIDNYYEGMDRSIQFEYKAGGSFEGVAEYSEGRVQFEISLESSTPSIGNGSYNYISHRKRVDSINGKDVFSHNTRDLQELDFGRYTTTKYKLNIDYVLLHHQNVAPSAKTEGYELLVRQQTFNRSVRKIKKAIRNCRELKIRLSNSHDYDADNQYVLVNPYQILIERRSGDPVIYGFVTQSMSQAVGPVFFSVPFISTIDCTGKIYKGERLPDLNPDLFTLEYPK